jgi:hypothetical protein
MKFHVAFSIAGIPTLRRDAGNTAFLVDSVTRQATGGRYTLWNGEARISVVPNVRQGGGVFGVKGLAMPVYMLLTFATCHTRD